MHPRESEDLDNASDEACGSLDEANSEAIEAKAAKGYASGVHEGNEHLNALVHKRAKSVVEKRPKDTRHKDSADSDGLFGSSLA